MSTVERIARVLDGSNAVCEGLVAVLAWLLSSLLQSTLLLYHSLSALPLYQTTILVRTDGCLELTVC